MFNSCLLLIAAGLAGVQMPADTLSESRISAEKILVASSRDTVSLKSSISLSEAVQAMPSVYLSDMGGMSGLKTISFRGLGSAHTTINIDGIRAINVQSGQNDLGMLGIEDFSDAVIDYATNSITFNTARPYVSGGKIGAKAGSFGTWQARGEYAHVLDDGRALKAGVTGLTSKGDFPYGDGQRRNGNDIRKIQAGLDLFARNAHVKMYVNSSDRGTPGSTSWPSEDRQKDNNIYVQGSWNIVDGLALNAKLSHDNLEYSTSYGDSRYDQTSALMNIDYSYKVTGWLSAMAMLDLEGDRLATDYSARRTALKPSLAALVDLECFKASVSADYLYVKDKDNAAKTALSPAVQLRFMPAGWLDITAYTRRAYRIPTFNDLYYTGAGNPDLKPEDAWLSDAGLAFHHNYGIFNVKANANIFYNLLTDKITWAPTPEDPNIWLPYNIGTVSNIGTDLSIGAGVSCDGFSTFVSAKYTFMDAVDKDNGQQIAYVPRNAASISADLSYRTTSANLIWNMKSGRKDSYGDMPDWSTIDLTVRQNIGKHISLALYGRNLTDRRYEISSGYPMPGISVMGGLELYF